MSAQQPLPGYSLLTEADRAVFAALGITDPAYLAAAGVWRVTTAQAKQTCGIYYHGDLDGVVFPRRDPITGHDVGYRVRRDHPEMEAGRAKGKYIASPDPHRLFYPPDVRAEQLVEATRPLVFVEAEKSALAVMVAATRAGRPEIAIALGGCYGWRGTIGVTVSANGTRVSEKGMLDDFARMLLADRRVVIAFDVNAAHNHRVRRARRRFAFELLRLGADVRILELSPVAAGVNGPDDFIGTHGDAAWWALVDGAKAARWPQDLAVSELLGEMGLDGLELQSLPIDDLHDRLHELQRALVGADEVRRQSVIVALQRAGVPGPLARAVRASTPPTGDAPERPALFPVDEPSATPVDGESLIAEIVTALETRVVLPAGAALVIALWVLHSWALDAFNISPFLLVNSPTKRCGKTSLLSVVQALCPRAVSASSVSGAAIYRLIEKYRPTLVLDEAETYIEHGNELMRGILNSGHQRNTARVIRCVGDDHEPTAFSTWGPKVVGMIGNPPDTVLDRSIVVALVRKPDAVEVAAVNLDIVSTLSELRRRACRWAADHTPSLTSLDRRAVAAVMPPAANDRARDNFAPLLAIAMVCGGTLASRAAEAISRLALPSDALDDETPQVQLLVDLQAIIAESTEERLPTSFLLAKLNALDDRPWQTYQRGGPLMGVGLATLLKRFKVRPAQWKGQSGKNERGYYVSELSVPIAIYVAPTGASGSSRDLGTEAGKTAESVGPGQIPEQIVAGQRNESMNSAAVPTSRDDAAAASTAPIGDERPNSPADQPERVVEAVVVPIGMADDVGWGRV